MLAGELRAVKARSERQDAEARDVQGGDRARVAAVRVSDHRSLAIQHRRIVPVSIARHLHPDLDAAAKIKPGGSGKQQARHAYVLRPAGVASVGTS